MSSVNAGRESPDPERQTGAQQKSPPASGQVSESKTNADVNKETIENLESNPKHVLEDHVNSMFTKEMKEETLKNV